MVNKKVPHSSRRKDPGKAKFSRGVTIGILVGCGADGTMVDFPSNPRGEPVPARSLTPLNKSDVGREAALMFEFGDPLRPLVIGIVQPQQVEPASAGIRLQSGVVCCVRSDRSIDVRPLDGGATVACQSLDLGGSFTVASGDTVAFLQSGASEGLALGIVRRASDRQSAHLSGRRVVLEALEEIVLKTPHSKLVLRENGDVEIQATRIVSRARTVQKLLAPMLKLN